MTLKGGVIIIGSLIWEDHLSTTKPDNIRRDWRKQNLLDERKLTKVPIRYGRESQTRKDTYTMVFSTSRESNLGQGLIFPFQQDITSFDELERQAIALAIAEGVYKKDNLRLTSTWGSVALLLNPNLKEKDFAWKEFIRKKWADIYLSYRDTFVADNYKADFENSAPITQEGFLNIAWQKEMDEFDLLIATPVVPKPKLEIPPEDIAERIKNKNYYTYFLSNQKHQIITTDDQMIKQLLETK